MLRRTLLGLLCAALALPLGASRVFDDGSSQYLTNATGVAASSTPITLAAWGYAAEDTGDVMTLVTLNTGSDDFQRLQVNTSTLTVGASTLSNGSFSISNTAGAVSTSTWFHAAAVFASATSRQSFLNGTASTADTTSRADFTPTQVDVGATDLSTGYGSYFSGRIAEAAVWDVALTTAEIQILADGISPIFVRPQNLLFYAPLYNSEDRDVVGGLVLTPSGSPTTAAHSRVFMPGGQKTAFFGTVTGGGNTSLRRRRN